MCVLGGAGGMMLLCDVIVIIVNIITVVYKSHDSIIILSHCYRTVLKSQAEQRWLHDSPRRFGRVVMLFLQLVLATQTGIIFEFVP